MNKQQIISDSIDSFIALQIAKFGALERSHLLKIGAGRFSQSTLYNSLNRLQDEKRVERLIHHSKHLHAFVSTPMNDRIVFGEDHKKCSGISLDKLKHTFACAEALIEFAHYSSVTGIASEFELDPKDISKFCRNRIPDGIIQIKNTRGHGELALEVECTARSPKRVTEVIKNYDESMNEYFLCLGVIVLCFDQGIKNLYLKTIRDLEVKRANNFILLLPHELSKLNVETFGNRLRSISNVVETVRNHSNGSVIYLKKIVNNNNKNEKNIDFNKSNIPTDIDGQTDL